MIIPWEWRRVRVVNESQRATMYFPLFKSILVVVPCAALGWYYLVARKRNELNEKNEPPMVESMSILKFIPNLLGKEGPQFLLGLARDMGTFVYRAPGSKSGSNFKFYLVADPPIARTILENPKNEKYLKFYKAFEEMAGGDTFFARNGTRATHVRKSLASAFTASNVKRMSDIVETVLEKWVAERLEPLYVKPKNPIEIDREMMLITTDLIFQVGFDYKLSTEERDLFSSCVACAMEEFFVTSNIWKKIGLTAWIFPEVRKARRAVKEQAKICTRVIETYRKNPKPDTSTLIHMLVNDQKYESDEQRTRDMLSIIFGAHDTTAHTISWTLLELARTPEEQRKVQSALSKCLSKEERRQCQELKNVTREILRLHTPAALGSIRSPAKDVILPDKKVITAGSLCVMPFYLILRNGNYFQDPDSFVPSRWNNPSEESLKAFFPFALGKRNCPGQALAHCELTIILSRLLTEYEFSVAEEGVTEYLVTLKSTGTKLWVKPITH
jgi:cytochrome P450